MIDSRFWRLSFVVFILALLYIGHGLHRTQSTPFPELTPTATAGDVAVFPTNDSAGHRIVTTNEDGTVIYVWHISRGSNLLKYYGRSSVKE